MGRQLNFWMTPADEQDFARRLAEDDVLWTNRSLSFGHTPKPHELSEWAPLNKEQRLIIVRRSEWNGLKYEHIAKSPLGDDDQFTPWTLVGCDSSPAFEWDTCHRKRHSIARGRIYLSTDWLEGGLVHSKDDDVIKWFNRLVAWLRRRGREHEEYPRHYLMPSAAVGLDSGQLSVDY